MSEDSEFRLSDSVILKIESEADKYPARKAAVKSALRYAQAEHGWISQDIVAALARLLNLEPIEVFEIAPFTICFIPRLLVDIPFGFVPMFLAYCVAPPAS